MAENNPNTEPNQSEMFKAMVERVKALEDENKQLREEQRMFLANWSTTGPAPTQNNKPKYRLTANGRVVEND